MYTLRSMLGHSGTCDVCGCFAHVWVPYDTARRCATGAGPQRCDDCETRHTVREMYRDSPEWARRIYCAATAEDALRLLGVSP